MTTYVRVPAVERALVGERVLVLRLDQDTPIELAGSAPTVWSVLEDASELPEIIQVVASIYTDTPEVIAAGVEEALRHLIDANLVVEQP
ncbi:MAG: PqqD family protein [Acidimicrobiales bacterium]|nr:PqqD family protein [Acidimicrobiales bacterium]RZV47960.1 MAG: PqqD family protein [Acidimicrobiales bacterium]